MSTKQFLGGRIILGTEYSGYKFYFFEPGTSTPKTTYKDSSLTVGNENADPVVLDANGAAQIWFAGNADVTFKTGAGVTVYTDSDINLTSTTTATGTGNLSLNPSFEDDTDADGTPDNWTVTLYTAGAFTIDTTDSYNGAQSIKFTSTGTGGGYITSTATFAISPSVIYSIGWAMKGTADVRNTVDVLWYQKDGSASATASTNVYDNSATNPTSWTEKWYETTSPSDAAFAAIRLTGCHSSDATAGTARFDQVVFTDLAHKRSPNTLFKALSQAKGANVATAAVCNIWTLSDGDTVHLTGTATTTSFGTATQAGCRKDCIVDGTFVITTGSNLIAPLGTMTAVAGDKFKVYADSVTKMYLFDYFRVNGQPLGDPTASQGAGLVTIGTVTALNTNAIIIAGSTGSMIVDFTAYPRYEIELRNVFGTAAGNTAVIAQFYTDGGTTPLNSLYSYIGMSGDSNTGTVSVHTARGGTAIALGAGPDLAHNATGFNALITFQKPDSDFGKSIDFRTWSGLHTNTADIQFTQASGHYYGGTGAINGIKIAPVTGVFGSGVFIVRAYKS